MWEVASLKTCHGLHMLSVTEVPDQPWLEAHKAPHCESRTSLWGEEKVIKKKKKKGSTQSEVLMFLLEWASHSLKI
jgi:hypothetical protein